MARPPIRVQAATPRPFTAWLEGPRLALEEGITGGVHAATGGLKLDLRRAIGAAGLGRRLGNAVGSAVYPRRGASIGAAGTIFPRGKSAERVLTAFSEGATIRARAGGRFLAIPTPNVPETGAAFGGGRRPMTPAEVERAFGARLVGIATRRGGRAAAVLGLPADQAQGVRGRRRGRRTLGVRRRRDFVPFFILVREVRLAKRFNARRLAALWAARVPGLIERALPPGGR